MLKISLFHQFIFKIQLILESHDQTFDQLLIFVNLYQHAKKSVHSSDTINFRVPSPDWPHLYLTKPFPKDFQAPFNLYELAKNKCMQKIQLIPSLHSSDTVNFRVRKSRLTTPIFDHAKPKNFRPTFNFCEFASTRKKCGCFIYLLWRNS